MRNVLENKTRLLSPSVVLLLFSFSTPAAPAGTIRHDVPDSVYRALAESPQYQSVGQLLIGTQQHSGTMIAADWVLTAAHLAPEAGEQATFVTNNGVQHSAAQWIVHPQWNGHFGNGYDLALVRLTAPVADVQPAQRYAGSDEFLRRGTMVGYGRTGTGLTGDHLAGGTVRAGVNVIDRIANNLAGLPLVFETDFDNPNEMDDSPSGTRIPDPLEYQFAPGDFGGGLFLGAAGSHSLAGIGSYRWDFDGGADSDYGDMTGFTRVSFFNDWINQQLGGLHWIGRSGDRADDSQSWALGAVPTSSDTVILSASGSHEIDYTGQNPSYGSVEIEHGDVRFLALEQMTVSDVLLIGDSGDASLTHDSGGTISTPKLRVGSRQERTGTLSVVGSTFNAGHVGVGTSGGATGRIFVSDQGLLTAGKIELGDNNETTSELNVTNGGIVNVSGELVVGASLRSNSNQINVSGQDSLVTIGSPDAGGLFIGDLGPGEVSISGQSTINVLSRTSVGYDGQASLAIRDQATMRSDKLAVGEFWHGTITLEDSAELRVDDTLVLGRSPFGVGTIEASGNTWISADELVVGQEGQGALNVSGLAEVVIDESIDIGAVEGSDGVLNISGGQVYAGTSITVGGVAGAAGGTGRLSIAGNGALTTPHSIHVLSDGTLHLGGGALQAENIDISQGGAFILDGGVVQAAQIDVRDTQGLSLQAGQVRTARIRGDLVQTGGELVPVEGGFLLDITEIGGDYTQAGGFLTLELGNQQSQFGYVPLVVTETATLLGGLKLSLEENYRPVGGDEFVAILADQLLGGFTSFEFPTLGGGLGFTTQTVVDEETEMEGIIAIVAGIEGDYNYDGIVDSADYTVWRNLVGSPSGLAADGNGDGTIDSADYDVWKANFGVVASILATEPFGGFGANNNLTTVPEPHSLAVIVLLLANTIGIRTPKRRTSLLPHCDRT